MGVSGPWYLQHANGGHYSFMLSLNNNGHRVRLDDIPASYEEYPNPSLGPETVYLACVTVIFLSLSGLISGCVPEGHSPNIHPKPNVFKF
jgi:hypothetical protein